MTVEQELERFYGDLRPDPDAERRVIAAVTASTTRAPRWRPVLVVALSAAAAVAAAVLVAVLRPDGHSQQHVIHDGPATVRLVIPPAQRNAVVGAVADNGRPLAGARVTLMFEPPAKAVGQLKPGQAFPLFRAGSATTDDQGGFTITVNPATVPPQYVEGSVLHADVTVELPDGRATGQPTPIRLTRGNSAPMRIVFDFGHKTITVNGETSALSWTALASTASSKPTR